MTNNLQVHNQEPIGDKARIRELNSLAVKGLVPMFDPENQMFCERLNRTPQGLKREGLSPRYTMMTLLGLSKGEEFGLLNPFDSSSILNGLLKSTAWIDNLGDLGLLLWLCALMAPERYDTVYGALNVPTALGHYREGRERRTMEMAWFLTGLAHGALAGHRNIPGLGDLARKSFDLLKKNQGRNGIFGHLSSGSGIVGAWRGRLGSFADQVYPIYAFSKFGRAFGDSEALMMAQACAGTICEAQGPLGQWWWHYDSQTGRVVGRYPVYSVHQDGMAPLALFALGESTERDYSPWIFKGLQWIYGNNELHRTLCETSTNIVWRSIYLPILIAYIKEAVSLLGFGSQNTTPLGLRVKFEDRPYHFGWVLYAFAQYGFA
ncbi:MAG: hypothetical protein ACYDA9_03045 [Terriglobia bacterium]